MNFDRHPNPDATNGETDQSTTPVVEGRTRPAAAATANNRIVEIPDLVLRNALETILGKTESDPITQSEMATLEHLYIGSSDLSDLTGLQFAVNLTSLSLYGNRIVDISALAPLTSLLDLTLGQNQIVDVTPLSGMTDLRKLALLRNPISDISALSSMVKLEELYIQETLISDISALTGMRELSRLNATSNSIAHIEPLAGKTKMKMLWLALNSISDLSALADTQELAEVNLYGNTISNLAPLTQLTKLRILVLSANRISDIEPLSGLTELWQLELGSNAISDLSPLAGLVQVARLDLGFNRIRRVESLSTMTGLRHLLLDANLISNVAPIGAMPNLHELSLDDNHLSDISALRKLNNLAYLTLGFNAISDIAALEFINGGFLSIVTLHNNLISDVSPLARNPNFFGSSFISTQIADIRHNPLSDLSLDEHIPTLRNKGVVVLDYDDHGDLPKDATYVEIGSITRGIASPSYDVDYFRLEIREDTTLQIFTTGGQPVLPSSEEGFKALRKVRYPSAFKVGRLYNDSGKLIANDGGDQSNFDIRLTLGPGVYYLSVTASGDGSRRYLINVLNAKEIEPDVAIPDPRLRAVVEAELGKDSGSPISSADIAKLSVIDAPAKGIVDLTGLEFATNLFALYLDNNLIHDISPLAGSVHLEELHLQINKVSDVSALQSHKALFILLLHSNSIQDISPLAGLVGMRYLFLQSNKIADISALADMDRLIELRLGANSIADLTPLAGMRLLRLHVQSNLITDLSPLATVSNLFLLDASNNRISYVAPLSALEHLSYLHLTGNLITDISPLENMPRLNVLHLESNAISDLSPIRTMLTLHELLLQYNRISDLSSLQEDPGGHLPRVLNLRGNPLSNESIAYLDGLEHGDGIVHAPDDHGDARGQPSALKLGEYISGKVPYGDVDFFRLDIEKATDVHLLLSAYGTRSGVVEGRMFDELDNELASNRGTGRQGQVLRVNRRLAPGTYYVEVLNDYDSDPVRYQLSAAAFEQSGADVPLFLAPFHQQRHSFVRVIHHRDEYGWVGINATDDSGGSHGSSRLLFETNRATQFNSMDLLQGDRSKLLYGDMDNWTGSLQLELHSHLDFDVLAYSRTPDGFVTPMYDVAPTRSNRYWIPTFNPASNQTQRSMLRLVNASGRTNVVAIEGIDDSGNVSADTVKLVLAPNAARTLTAEDLEFGSAEIEGCLGVGVGKRQLYIESSQPLRALNLMESPNGYLNNLSASPPKSINGVHQVHLFPAAADLVGRQGFVRVINHSGVAGEVTIMANDHTDWSYPPIVLSLGALESKHLNSTDLEQGNQGKGLSDGVGSGVGDWRLALSSELDIDVLAYIRMPDGFLTGVQANESMPRQKFAVPMFNPGSNFRQLSSLRLINSGAEVANVTIRGTDDLGVTASDTVRLTIRGNTVRVVRANDLELGGSDLQGVLGDGYGKWQLSVTSDQSIWLMNLMESPTGHITNVTGSRRKPLANANSENQHQ